MPLCSRRNTPRREEQSPPPPPHRRLAPDPALSFAVTGARPHRCHLAGPSFLAASPTPSPSRPLPPSTLDYDGA
uniref:Predicted protein n=1 Tax=Hordeum vulgare subsp. vulgare TaxID=112509 RepID=F2E8J6_HORVV|nr:predicted protein [Hordeum vulgare subsp. vulgare]